MDTISSALRQFLVVGAIILLAGCGGGGGGSSGGSNSSTPATTFTVSTTTLSATAPLNRDAPYASFSATVQNIPAAGLYYGIAYTLTGIADGGVAANTVGDTLNVQVSFRSPLSLGVGTYSDLIRVSFCYDSACTQLVAGSPRELTVQYTVTAPDASISFDSANTNISAFITEPLASTASFYTSMQNMPVAPGFYEITHTNTAIDQFNSSVSGGQGFVYVVPKATAALGAGVHTDTVTITACWDAACTMPLVNSPLTIPVTFTINDTVAGSEGYTARLATDILAKAFEADDTHGTLVVGTSASSTAHANELVSIDPASGAVINSIGLGTEPSNLDVSADGTYAYVGFASANQVKRYALANFSLNSTISLGSVPSLGPLYAADLQVSPTNNQQVAVIARPVGSYTGKASVFNNTTELASYSNSSRMFNTIRWGSSTQLFASSSEISPAPLLELTLGSTTLTEAAATSGIINYERFVFAGGLIYVDGGMVYDPLSQSTLGRFGSLSEDVGVVAADTALNRAYFMSSGQIRVYDLTSRTLLRSTQLPGISYIYNAKLLRWGTDGLAFADGAGRLIILDGPFVTQ